MTTKGTLPFDQLTRGTDVKFSTLVATVLEGPDAGLEARSETPLLSVGTADGNELRLTDRTVSGYHLEFEWRGGEVRITDHRSTNGTRVGAATIERARIALGTEVRVGASVVRIGLGETQRLQDIDEGGARRLIGSSEVMQTLRARTAKAATAGTSVLIIGESGTGKELVARALHEDSPRSDGPFVVVDCGAIASDLVATELFGHEKGAFTGAERMHLGAFERADGGTLFLDELGELSPALQPVLLGALERGCFRRVGGQKERHVDVRVVAATNRDLRADVNRGHFRLDLYYRLAVVTLKVPPLRERREDLRSLIAFFRRELPPHSDALFADALFADLRHHSWPGNVRELRNLVMAVVAMGEDVSTLVAPAPEGQERSIFEDCLSLPYTDARDAVLRAFERQYIEHHIEASEGNVAAAARAAKMDRSHLFQLLKRHGLK